MVTMPATIQDLQIPILAVGTQTQYLPSSFPAYRLSYDRQSRIIALYQMNFRRLA